MVQEHLAGHYEIVLRDLRNQRTQLALQLNELDVLIGSFQKLVGPAAPLIDAARAADAMASPGEAISFKRMSVRWSVLAYLYAAPPSKTGDIVAGLKAGGMEKEGIGFTNSVSAVISQLRVKPQPELTQVGDGVYTLTPAGRQMWESIRQSPKFIESQQQSTMFDESETED